MIFWWQYVSKVDLLLAIYHISRSISFVQMFLDVLQLYVFRKLCCFEFMFQEVFHVSYVWCLGCICFLICWFDMGLLGANIARGVFYYHKMALHVTLRHLSGWFVQHLHALRTNQKKRVSNLPTNHVLFCRSVGPFLEFEYFQVKVLKALWQKFIMPTKGYRMPYQGFFSQILQVGALAMIFNIN